MQRRKLGGHWTVKVVIRLVAIAAQSVEICARSLRLCIAAVCQSSGKVYVCPVSARHGESKIFKQFAGDVKRRIISATDCGTPLAFRAADGELNCHWHEITAGQAFCTRRIWNTTEL